ncbi:MAG: 3-oxoacyl-ACP reductase FabG [Chloroflexota bacterium]
MMPEGRLTGKVAVVTGSSSGIGRAVALAYAREGAAVVVNYRRSAEAAAEVVAQITAIAGEGNGAPRHAALAVQADVAHQHEVERLLHTAMDRFGRIDVWMNNAGADILPGSGHPMTDEEKWQAVLAVDLTGTFHCSRLAGAAMRHQQGGGRIINMSWDHVAAGQAGTIATIYAAAKGGVEALSRCLARDLAPHVAVNVIAPGWIRTRWGQTRSPQIQQRVLAATPLGRWGTPEDVAGVAVFLASDEASFMTGQTIMVNGGVVM